jgi:hypothetical protein
MADGDEYRFKSIWVGGHDIDDWSRRRSIERERENAESLYRHLHEQAEKLEREKADTRIKRFRDQTKNNPIYSDDIDPVAGF